MGYRIGKIDRSDQQNNTHNTTHSHSGLEHSIIIKKRNKMQLVFIKGLLHPAPLRIPVQNSIRKTSLLFFVMKASNQSIPIDNGLFTSERENHASCRKKLRLKNQKMLLTKKVKSFIYATISQLKRHGIIIYKKCKQVCIMD